MENGESPCRADTEEAGRQVSITANGMAALCQIGNLSGRDFIARGLGPPTLATSEKFAQKFALVWGVGVVESNLPRKKSENGRIQGGLSPLAKSRRWSVSSADGRTAHRPPSKEYLNPHSLPSFPFSFSLCSVCRRYFEESFL